MVYTQVSWCILCRIMNKIFNFSKLPCNIPHNCCVASDPYLLQLRKKPTLVVFSILQEGMLVYDTLHINILKYKRILLILPFTCFLSLGHSEEIWAALSIKRQQQLRLHIFLHQLSVYFNKTSLKVSKLKEWGFWQAESTSSSRMQGSRIPRVHLQRCHCY